MNRNSRQRTRAEATTDPPAPGRRLPAAALLLAASVLLAAAATGPLHAQANSPRQRVMYVTVTDHSGAPVPGITPDDLVIREDGVRREVLRVEPATSPIEITLVVDTSEVASPQIPDIRRALAEFVTDMAKGNDIAVTTIGGRPQIVQNYTASPELLNRAIGRLFAEQGNGAYLLEALSSVAAGVAKRAPERAAIIAIVMQAGPEFSNQPYDTVVKALAGCGATFDAIVLAPPPPAETPAVRESARGLRDRDLVLDQASRATGGVNIQALSGMAVGPEMKSLAAQLRNQYRVVYARPESLIPPEKIEVSATKPGLTARGTLVRVQR